MDSWLYDGRTAARHAVAVEAAGDALRLTHRDGRTDEVAAARLFHATDRDGALVYGRTDAEGWRLGLPTPVPDDIAALLPGQRRYGRWIDRVGLVPALVVLILVSGAVLLLGHVLPGLLAPVVPASWEQRYGDALVGDFGDKFCRGPGGQEALAKLAARLQPPAKGRRRFDMRVVDVPIVNAAALPGNHIVIFRELLAEADGPDELAGVLAHEIAHVDNRDVTEGMIRELGFGMVITALGGTTGGNADMLLGSRYTRAAEAAADRDAIAALRRAGISPVPTAKFFARLGAGERKLGRIGAAFSYLSTHPLSDRRRAAFQNSYDPHARYTPALNRDDWEAIFNICFNDPRKRAARKPPQALKPNQR